MVGKKLKQKKCNKKTFEVLRSEIVTTNVKSPTINKHQDLVFCTKAGAVKSRGTGNQD